MRLIRGAAGAGKTRLILQHFRQALALNRNAARLLVPTATLVRHLRNELARDGVIFPPNAVQTLAAFTGANKISKGLRQAIVAHLLRQQGQPAFLTATVLDAINRLENANATPEAIRAPELKPLVRIWQALRAQQPPRPLPLGIDHLFLDGFQAFSPAEAQLLRQLNPTTSITLTLTDSDATREARRLALELGATDHLLTGPARNPSRHLVEAATAEREADEIARRILHLRQSGLPFREIAVALRDPATYATLLQSTFERFKIPARFYFEHPLETHPAAIFFSGLIEGALQGWEFEQALHTFRAHPAWGHTPEFDRFDFHVREHMPGHGAQALLEHTESEWLRARLQSCLRLESWVPKSTTPAGWLERFEDLADTLYPPDPHPAAIDAWLAAIRDAAAFWPDADLPVTLEQFWQVARETLAGASYQTPDDRRDVVHVLHVYEARQWDVQALFVCGATDRAFPQRRAPNALLTEDLVRTLRNKGIPLRNAEEEEADEVALVHTLQTRATQHLVFTYPLQDASGRLQKPSRLLPEMPVEKARAARPAGLPLNTASPDAGRIETPALVAALTDRHREVRLTSLENLMQCRFQFFADRTLELRGRPQRPAERLEARIGGLILHQALEHWQEDMSQDFARLFEDAFEEAILKHRLPHGYRLEVERLTLGRIARKVAAKQRWEPLSTQVEVPLKIAFPNGITANCRVDRIDTLPDNRCIIVDYKAGKVANVEKLVDSQVSLQGPLYARAVREGLGLTTTAMIFWAIRDDKLIGWGHVDGMDELVPMPNDWADDAYRRASERLADFLLGHIQPQPTDEGRCRWCDYEDTCRIETRRTELTQIAGSYGN